MSPTKMSKKEISADTQTLEHRWDLSALFKSVEDLDAHMASLDKKIKAYEKKYANSFAQLEAGGFKKAMEDYEELSEGISRAMSYVFLILSTDMEKSDLASKYQLLCSELGQHLLFVENEFCALDSAKQEALIQATPKYAYTLRVLLQQKAHILSLAEEKVLLATSSVGVDAFSQLFDKTLTALKIPFQDRLVSEEEILSELHNPDRKLRKKAQKALTKALKKNEMVLTYVLNMVRKDLHIDTKLRHYEKPESFRHLSNQIPQASVDSMLEIVNDNYALVQRYYKIKSKLLGYKLKDYDRYAPIDTKENPITYQEALDLVLKAYKDFSPKFHSIAEQALAHGWVDSHPRPLKRGGAFSDSTVPSAHPFVLLNFTNNRRSAFTIAHEFGHMIHQTLSKQVGYLNANTPLTTSETASVFGEMLLFESLKPSLNKKELRNIYAGKLEDMFSTMFRQVVMTNFERRIHSTENELKAEDFDTIWQEENAKMFGKSVKLTKNYARWWSYIPHFIHSPFYCYAYSYGQLLVLALFGLYRQKQTPSEKKAFVETYTEFLSKGGSQSPEELVGMFGLDIADKEFWKIGMGEVEKMLGEFEDLL
ncbi:M3 family oligoendopeptidase [Helicobacter felis]|uniref:Oligoendopeptidase F, peptidase (M3 family) n=1 Tax=Helicobacter felis (strain ATCC 49179 / CCUG 28539 / NCTC 12436 / CS1) TaxID=936155 RepID=E7ACC9_HELFC|nr:Oligoendopeptidase F, peptidase (M3 family) [Helicobacter felis ATCC 49179]